jgi:mono/diheme cytochrome c family protein
VAAAVVSLLLAAGSLAGATEPVGEVVYQRYCGACHGPHGKGDGLAGTFMTPKPPDLSKLAAKSGGTFRTMAIMRYIDGTETVRAHGDPAMPVWGEIFRLEAAAPASRRIEVQGKLLLITEYLRTIQAP